jgi:2-polyprenyl-3-methyl-5-hydroxy-6-metoxy-1,4-benzoquinol methylase
LGFRHRVCDVGSGSGDLHSSLARSLAAGQSGKQTSAA